MITWLRVWSVRHFTTDKRRWNGQSNPWYLHAYIIKVRWTTILGKNHETQRGFRIKTGIAFTFPPSLLTRCWPNGKELFPNHSTLIQGGRGGFVIVFCEAEVKKLLVLLILFWLSHYILSKIVDESNEWILQNGWVSKSFLVTITREENPLLLISFDLIALERNLCKLSSIFSYFRRSFPFSILTCKICDVSRTKLRRESLC